MKATLYTLLILVFSFTSIAQIYTEEDLEICNNKFELAVSKNLSEKPINDVIIEIGKSFIGTDYEAFALEKPGDEDLIINLNGLDCTTYMENVLTLSRLVKKQEYTFDDYLDELKFIRYRDGIINGYPSRLHYFTDWISDNQQKNVVTDITKSIGGELYDVQLNFMSTHPEYYLHLKNNQEFIKIIEDQEIEISMREYYYIPKNRIKELENNIESGNLIALTSNVKGLDVGHVGIALKKDNGRIYFLHSPNKGMKVQITDKTLYDYLSGLSNFSGIIVLKVEEPLKRDSGENSCE